MKKRTLSKAKMIINPRAQPRRERATIMEEEEEGRKLAKERCLPPNLTQTSNLEEQEEVERERKMMTSKLAKCFSSNKKETGGMLTEGKEEGEEEVKTMKTGHEIVIPTTKARIGEGTISRCLKLLLRSLPMQIREAARMSTATTGTVVAVAEGS